MRRASARSLAALALFLWLAGGAAADTLQRGDVERLFPAPFVVGERDPDNRVWPIFKQNATADELVAYIFESVDFAPIPGFSGTPINLLIALSPQGEFMEVRVLSHHEPVFLDGLGEEPLFEFVKQYQGTSLKQSIKVDSRTRAEARATATTTVIDGVAKATASVRIVNETVVAAALDVARRKLGFAAARDPSKAARVRSDLFEPLGWQDLVARGYVRRLRLSSREVESAFRGTPVEGLDAEALADPEAAFLDIHVAQVDVPSIGRNLLDEQPYAKLITDLDGASALLVISSGHWSFVADDFVPGAVPDRLALAQDGAPVAMRDFAWRGSLAGDGVPRGDAIILRISPQAAFNPAASSALIARITREKGQIFPERFVRDFTLLYELPERLFILPATEAKGPWPMWRDRAVDLVLLSLALAALSFALLRQRALVRSPKRFAVMRTLFLVFTLGFIGWWAQAQLSIVTLIGAVKALRQDGSLAFLLYDPPSLLLWAFTFVSLIVWGRGTFCGWLCPFGALQELAGGLARWARLPQWRIDPRLERVLTSLKYLVLAAILAAAALSASLADWLAEIEPFKTAITLMFVRSLPFVLYATGLIALGMVNYKFFCRFLCPLGAALAIGGAARRLDWIPRRAECGSPCQLCRRRCRYGAIEASGRIAYSECFQCMDCVVIHDDQRQCVPLVLQGKSMQRVKSLEETVG